MNKDYKERVTIYEVAKAAGVSLATVSRVINNTTTVKEETRDKVLSIINKLGYKPSGLAQALATNKTTSIGIIIPSANYVYISNMLNGIIEVCKSKGFTTNLYTSSHSRTFIISSSSKSATISLMQSMDSFSMASARLNGSLSHWLKKTNSSGL